MTGLTPISFRAERASEPRLSKPRVRGRHSERYWSDEELATLRERYPKFGARGCIPFLTKRTVDQIYSKAGVLGLKAPSAPAERAPVQWTPELDDRIRAAFPGLTKRGAVAALAAELRVKRSQLSDRMEQLGLTMPRVKEPNWTEAEVALMRKVPLHDLERCARIFRGHGFTRSKNSIMVKAKRLSLSRRTHETLSACSAAKILGVDAKWITARCIAGDLKAGRRGTSRLVQQGGDVWSIEPGDLRAYVLDNLGFIDIRKVDKFAFVALLLGPVALAGPSGETPAAGGEIAQDRELQAAVTDALPEDAFVAPDGRTPRIPAFLGGVCRACGCSQNDACDEGCGWADEDLCTACAPGASA